MGHNHLELEKEIEKYTIDKIPKNGKRPFRDFY